MTSYAELLRDPRWQRRRLEVMERARFACERCQDDKTTLNVHHRIYRRGCKPWEYADHELLCLCEPCHTLFTEAADRLKEAISLLDLEQIQEVAGYARGLALRRRIIFDEPLSDAPGALFDSSDWYGVAAALHLASVLDLCDGRTSEADLAAAVAERARRLS